MSAFASIAAAAEGAPEPSKIAFYIGGGVLVAWAVLVSLIGIARPDFPAKGGPARLTILLSVVFVLGALSTSVLTS